MESGLGVLFDVLITAMTGYLFLISLFGSVFAQTYAESGNLENIQTTNFFLPDHWGLNFLFLVGLCLFFRLCRKRWMERKKQDPVQTIWKWMCIIYLLAGVLFIFSIKLQPKSDPAKVLNVAEQLLEGDHSSFTDPEGYMFRYPFQNGILLLDVGLLCLFGNGAYLAFQVLNLIAAIGISDAIGRISEKILCHKNGGYWIRITILLQPVLFLYITYMYGTLLSLACILYAAYFEMRFLRAGGKKDFLLCAFLSGLSLVLKSNSMIPLLGMLIFLFIDLLKKKEWGAVLRNLLMAAGILISCALFREGVNLLTEMISKTAMPAGMPKLNWIAMGLSGDGTYNGVSVNIFRESGFDTNQSIRDAWANIKGSLKYFLQHKGYFAAWYGKKIALQWNDPSFGAIQINRLRETACHSRIWQEVLYGRVGSMLWSFLDYIQSAVLFGALVWCMGTKKQTESFFFGVISLGGFLFHSFWEAGSQYILPYYLLLLPYAVMGWRKLCSAPGLVAMKRGWENKPARVKMSVMILAMIVSLLGAKTWLVRSLIRIQDEPSVLREFDQREKFNYANIEVYNHTGH